MYKPRPKTKLSVKVRGFFATPIKYEIRNPMGDWTPFLSPFQDQRFGRFDSDSCWVLGGMITPAEINLNWLWANDILSQEAKDFFISNGYVDSNGKFSLSERFHEILCGQRDNGGTSPMAWQSAQKRGFIPRSQLTYTIEQSNSFNSQEDFDNDYFNTKAITPQMIALGQQSLKYINIAYQIIGKNWTNPTLDILGAALKLSPVCMGLPTPVNVLNWNNAFVQYDGATVVSHEVTGVLLASNGYGIVDQYNPFQKTLSSDYYLPLCTQGIIYAIAPAIANPIPQPTSDSMWSAIFNWLNSAFQSFSFGT